MTNFCFDRVELVFVVTSAYFATYCLRKIWRVTWKDKIPNTEILPHCNITSVESIIMASQLRWSGHLARIRDDCVPKALMFELLEEDRRSRGGQRKRYKDVLKTTMKACNIVPATSDGRGSEKSRWRKVCHDGTAHLESNRSADLIIRREARLAAVTNPPPTSLCTHTISCLSRLFQALCSAYRTGQLSLAQASPVAALG